MTEPYENNRDGPSTLFGINKSEVQQPVQPFTPHPSRARKPPGLPRTIVHIDININLCSDSEPPDLLRGLPGRGRGTLLDVLYPIVAE
jgi:hypothetical protein